MMPLHYLDFDYSEDDEGTGTWDAMASATPQHWDAVLTEVAQVLRWAHGAFAGRRGAIENGADWDYDLQGVREVVTVQHLQYDDASQALTAEPAPTSTCRYTLSLSISGRAAFSAALREEFGLP